MKTDLKSKILALHQAGKTADWIAAKLKLPRQNVNYYLRTYAGDTGTTVKYDLDVLLALKEAKDRGTLVATRAMYELSEAGASILLKKLKSLPQRRAIVYANGYFNPKKARDCWAMGLAYFQVAAAVKFLTENRLRLVPACGEMYLESMIPHQRRRVKLSLEQEVQLLQDPKKWLLRNAVWIKESWERIVRKGKKQPEDDGIEIDGVVIR